MSFSFEFSLLILEAFYSKEMTDLWHCVVFLNASFFTRKGGS